MTDNANCDYTGLQSNKNTSINKDVLSRCLLIRVEVKNLSVQLLNCTLYEMNILPYCQSGTEFFFLIEE